MTDPAPLHPRETAMLAILTRAAARGEPCPQNGELAEAIGLGSGAQASIVITRLEALGLITIIRAGRAWRRVRVTATGQTTAQTRSAASPRAAARLDELAQLVADGASLKSAAATMGFSEARVWQLWAKIRNQLGWQAQ